MAETRAPFTGFGDDTNTSVKFAILAPDGRMPNWQGEARVNKFPIPHSARTVSQYGGRGEWSLTFRAYFDTIGELELLDELQGTRHTLRYLSGVTKRAGGTVVTLQGIQYLELSDTMLDAVTDEMYEVDGTCEATLTFSRAAELSAYYGFAVYAEDE